MKQSLSYWESQYLQDDTYKSVGFKTLKEQGYPPYDISKIPVDHVELDEFLKLEDDRLPLLIGTQFGFFPRLDKIDGFLLEPRIIALLSKSVLSGNVAGLSICLIDGDDNKWKVIRDFPNKMDYDASSVAREINPGKDFGCVTKTGEKLTVE